MKKIIALGVALAAGLTLLLVAPAFTFVTVLGGASPAGAACPGAAQTAIVTKIGQLKKFGVWNAKQVANAAEIIAVGIEKDIPTRGWIIAVATAMQESTLHNYGHLGDRNDHDSQGLFQQRPSQGWGSVEQVRDPKHAAGKFYTRMTGITGWLGMRLTDVAQKVQRSAFPEAYQKWEDQAEKLVAHITGLGPNAIAQLGAGPPGAECDTKPANQDEPTATGGWVNPVKAIVGSGFRTARRPNHQGIDLIAPRHTPIWSAAAGKVIRIRCNSSSGTCDRDGSPSVKGCGWYVEVRHAGNIVTRYCHMVSRPRVEVGDTVRAGQLLGNVGSSGGSSGPHLHYEVHRNVRAGGYVGSVNAVNPVRFHQALGVPLGRK